MPENWDDGLIWILSTLVIAVTFDRAVLWLIPRVVSVQAIAAIRRRAGGVNRLVFHGLNTPVNCRTPLSTADALMTLCPYDVSVNPLRLRVTIPDDTYWSICCYGPNADNIFAMNDRQVLLSTASHVQFALHHEVVPCVIADNEISIPLKSPYGILLIRTAVPDPHDQRSLANLELNQRLAFVVDRD